MTSASILGILPPMSVTFSVSGLGGKFDIPCKECGLSPMQTIDIPEHECDECLKDPEYELNLCTGNALDLLMLLDLYEERDGLFGEVSGQDLLIRLAVKQDRMHQLVKEPVEHCGVIVTMDGVAPGVKTWVGGRTIEQVTRYWDMLRKFAEMAIQLDEKVCWI